MASERAEKLRELVDGALYTAFESGWFDNHGDIGEAWAERKADLPNLIALIVEELGITEYAITENCQPDGGCRCPSCDASRILTALLEAAGGDDE